MAAAHNVIHSVVRRGDIMARRCRAALGLTLISLVGLALCSTSASALSYQHVGAFDAGDEIGAGALGIAVNQTGVGPSDAGDLFVTNPITPGRDAGEIKHFSAAGTMLGHFGTRFFDGIELDHRDGSLWTLDNPGPDGESTAGALVKLTPEGAEQGIVVPVTVTENMFEIAVDSAGNVYYPDITTGTVLRFGPNGESLGTAISGLTQPRTVAIDPDDNFYVTDSNGAWLYRANGTLVRAITLNSGEAGRGAGDIAVNSVTGEVFVAKGTGSGVNLVAYDMLGNELDQFGLGDFTRISQSGFAQISGRIAVNESTGMVMVSDASGGTNGRGEIEMYLLGEDPVPPVVEPPTTVPTPDPVARTRRTQVPRQRAGTTPSPKESSASGRTSVVGSLARVRGGRAALKVRCSSDRPAPCSGRLRLYSLRSGKRSGGLKSVSMGSGSYRVPSGKQATVRLGLSRAGRRVVRGDGRGVRVWVVGSDLRKERSIRLRAASARR